MQRQILIIKRCVYVMFSPCGCALMDLVLSFLTISFLSFLPNRVISQGMVGARYSSIVYGECYERLCE